MTQHSNLPLNDSSYNHEAKMLVQALQNKVIHTQYLNLDCAKTALCHLCDVALRYQTYSSSCCSQNGIHDIYMGTYLQFFICCKCYKSYRCTGRNSEKLNLGQNMPQSQTTNILQKYYNFSQCLWYILIRNTIIYYSIHSVFKGTKSNQTIDSKAIIQIDVCNLFVMSFSIKQIKDLELI